MHNLSFLKAAAGILVSAVFMLSSYAIFFFSPSFADQIATSAKTGTVFTAVMSLAIAWLAAVIVLSLKVKNKLSARKEINKIDIKEAHQTLLTILDSLDANVYVADMENYEILFANRHLSSSFGEIAGKVCWQVFYPENSGPCNCCVNAKLPGSQGKASAVNVRKRQNKMTNKWFEIREREIRWLDGRLARLEIATEITDQKLAKIEPEDAQNEIRTFGRIIKKLGTEQTLEGIGAFLIKELKGILCSRHLQLYVFSSDHSSLFIMSEKGTRVIENQELIQSASAVIGDLDGIVAVPDNVFDPFLLPDDFPAKERQIIIPFQIQDHFLGAFVIACTADCLCEENKLDLVALILDQASPAIKRAVIHREEIDTSKSCSEKISGFGDIIGKDLKMQKIYNLIKNVAATDSTILIQGETGTGKEVVARTIWQQSSRKDKPFVVINCSAYPAALLESELFGHEKGAFTGATRQKAGRFELAKGGTVFLDEIGEIPLSAQIKLLRVLQTKRFRRIGGERTVAVNVRILAATNKDLLQEVKNGNFREDLYYRLNVILIQLPPLRLRRNDIPLLIRHFQRRFASKRGYGVQDISSDAMQRFMDYPWPGNVRELENSFEHAFVMSKGGGRIEISHLPSGLLRDDALSSLPTRSMTMVDHEKRILVNVLEECNWNKSHAARNLGISRSTLYDKLKKFKIPKTAAS